MTSYDACKDFIVKHGHLDASPILVFLISATLAETLSGFFWTPMERLKAKQQAELHDFELALDDDDLLEEEFMASEGVSYPRPHLSWQEPSSAWQIAETIYKDDGWIGFFRGFWLGLAVYIPHSMIYFTLYEEVTLYYLPGTMDRLNILATKAQGPRSLFRSRTFNIHLLCICIWPFSRSCCIFL
jgi:solute carrier family 25 S-adenosylmethionine transporter 26